MARIPSWRNAAAQALRARNAVLRQAQPATPMPPSTAFSRSTEYVAPEPDPASVRVTRAGDPRVTRSGDRRVTR